MDIEPLDQQEDWEDVLVGSHVENQRCSGLPSHDRELNYGKWQLLLECIELMETKESPVGRFGKVAHEGQTQDGPFEINFDLPKPRSKAKTCPIGVIFPMKNDLSGIVCEVSKDFLGIKNIPRHLVPIPNTTKLLLPSEDLKSTLLVDLKHKTSRPLFHHDINLDGQLYQPIGTYKQSLLFRKIDLPWKITASLARGKYHTPTYLQVADEHLQDLILDNRVYKVDYPTTTLDDQHTYQQQQQQTRDATPATTQPHQQRLPVPRVVATTSPQCRVAEAVFGKYLYQVERSESGYLRFCKLDLEKHPSVSVKLHYQITKKKTESLSRSVREHVSGAPQTEKLSRADLIAHVQKANFKTLDQVFYPISLKFVNGYLVLISKKQLDFSTVIMTLHDAKTLEILDSLEVQERFCQEGLAAKTEASISTEIPWTQTTKLRDFEILLIQGEISVTTFHDAYTNLQEGEEANKHNQELYEKYQAMREEHKDNLARFAAGDFDNLHGPDGESENDDDQDWSEDGSYGEEEEDSMMDEESPSLNLITAFRGRFYHQILDPSQFTHLTTDDRFLVVKKRKNLFQIITVPHQSKAGKLFVTPLVLNTN